MTVLKNMTPHPITILDVDKKTVIRTIESSGLIRLQAYTVSAGFTVDGCRISRTEFGQPEGLPNEEPDTFYIVSQLVKSALPNRSDLLVPAEMVRDEKGNIVGCCSLGI